MTRFMPASPATCPRASVSAGVTSCPSRAHAPATPERIEYLSDRRQRRRVRDVIAARHAAAGQPGADGRPLVGHRAIPAGSSRLRRLAVGLRATLADGSDAQRRAGRDRAVPQVTAAGAAHGNGGAASSDGGNGPPNVAPQGRAGRSRSRWQRMAAAGALQATDRVDPEQTHENWVCVISDDASGDPERLDAMREVLGDDPASACMRPTSGGASTATSSARSSCPRRRPSSVALCDQDDHWHPDKLADAPRGARRRATSSPTATCASSRRTAR